MRPRQKIFLVLIALFPYLGAFSQHSHPHPGPCGQGHLEQQLMDSDPDLANFIQAEDLRAIQEQQSGARATGQVYVVPVVFHILHDNGPENVSDLKVKQAIADVNLDFSGRHPDLDDVVAAFQPVIGNAEMEFRLATRDPNGNVTSGIVRYLTTDTYTGNDNAKQGRIWPRESYLNIWVVNEITVSGQSGIAGYSFRPAAVDTDPGRDGVVVEYNYIGGNDDSHTLAHEIGHWANLKHTWGGTNNPALAINCNDDDDVTDTPNTLGQSGGCNVSANTCGSLDNIQNIMNYANCPAMFTDGQITRMRNAMTSIVAARSNLWTTNNLAATGVIDLTVADFTVNNRVICSGESVTYTDASSYGATNWDWTFESGQPGTSTDQNPSVLYYTPGIYQVGLVASDGTNSLSKSSDNFVMVTSATGIALPYTEDFEQSSSLPTSEWLANDVDGDLFGYGLASNTAFSGSNSVKMNNFGSNTGRLDELLSTSFDLSTLTDLTLTFQAAYAENPNASGNNNLRVYISDDCGETWTLKYISGGSGLATVPAQTNPFTPNNASQWVLQTVTNFNIAELTENVRFKFEFISGAGNNLYLDDINLTGTFRNEPVLEYPPNASTERPDNVVLDWKALPNVNGYEYELSTDTNFGNVVFTGTTNYIDNGHFNTDTEIPTSGLTHGQKYFWRVRALQSGGPSGWSEIWSFTVDPNGVSVNEINTSIRNLAVYPNPLTEESVLEYDLSEPGNLNLEVTDLFGRTVRVIAQGSHSIGNHRYAIPNQELSSGVYFIRLTHGNETQTLRAIVR
ncbi:MAG: M43 family zinc metalloprotease [Salibacteraceae bacterium]